MAITKVQSVTGNGATLTLNGVAAANALSYIGSLFRNPTTGAAFGTPTDTNGTLSAVSNDVPQTNSAGDIGAVIWAEKNTASGTHTVTPPTNSGHNSTLTEWSGCDTVNLIGAAASAKTAQGSQLSQVTGTTNGTPNSGDLALIALCLGDAIGGSGNIGLTDPVNANYTTLQLNNNSLSDLGTQHAFQVLSSGGAQSATFNWTFNDAGQFEQGCIGILAAASGAAPDQIWAEDANGQQHDVDEDFGFYDLAAPSPDQIVIEDASAQPSEADEEPFGFTVDPLSPDLPAQTDQFISYFPDEAEEPEQEWLLRDFSDYIPLDAPVDQIFVEDGALQPVEAEELSEIQGYIETPQPDNAQDAIYTELADNQQPEDEFAEGFAAAPLSANASPVGTIAVRMHRRGVSQVRVIG